jgi:phosphate transport system permease protein
MSAVETSPLTRRKDRLGRRKAVNRGMELLAMTAAAIGVAILAIVVYKIVRLGFAAINWDLFTLPRIPDAPPGIPQGLADAFAGTLVIVGLAAAMGIPYGILVAIYLVEFAPRRIRNAISLTLDVLMGIPAIVLGIFYYGLLVLTTHQQRGLWGSIALATMMIPLVARSTMEILLLVPNSLREASLGLGVPRWRTTLGVVLPQAVGGIVTGSILAISRIAGEAAPLLFLTSLSGNTVDWNPLHPLGSVPLAILGLAEEPYPESYARAWAAALVLVAFILVANLGARWLAARSKRKLGRAVS